MRAIVQQNRTEGGRSWMGFNCVSVCVSVRVWRVHTNCFHTHAFNSDSNRKIDFQPQLSARAHFGELKKKRFHWACLHSYCFHICTQPFGQIGHFKNWHLLCLWHLTRAPCGGMGWRKEEEQAEQGVMSPGGGRECRWCGKTWHRGKKHTVPHL